MEQTMGNVTVTAELHESDPETLTSLGDVRRKFGDLGDEMKEHAYAVFLNASNEVMAEKLIGLGSVSATGIDCADVVRTAALTNAAAVILVHNHPSGDPTPTQPDVDVTEAVRDTLDLLDIDLLDHVIITRNGSHSMRQHNDLRFNGSGA